MKRREYFLYAKKIKIMTLFNNLSPPRQRIAILENIRWTQTAYAVLCQPHHTDMVSKLWFERKQRIRVVRLTQNSVRSLRPADILQNGTTLTQRRQIYIYLAVKWDSHKPPGFHQKYLKLFSEDEQSFYRFGTTWGKWLMTTFSFWGGVTLRVTESARKNVGSAPIANCKYSTCWIFTIKTPDVWSAMKAYRVPWGESLPMHPIIAWFDLSSSSHFTSWMYRKALEATKKTLSYTAHLGKRLSTRGGCYGLGKSNLKIPITNWFIIIFVTELIGDHSKDIVSTPPLVPSVINVLTNNTDPFFIWCGNMKNFGMRCVLSYQKLLIILYQWTILLLSDDSLLNFSKLQKTVWLAGLTSAKQLLAQHWLPPHSLDLYKWLTQLRDIIMLELSTARENVAQMSTLKIWARIHKDSKNPLRELLI